MAIELEKRLFELENEIKALKATYTIYGGLVKSYLNTFSWTNDSNISVDLKIKFHPNYHLGVGNTLVFGFYYSAVWYSVEESLDDGYISIQDGSGDIIINLSHMFEGLTVNLTLLTSVPGTFTRIQ